LRSFYSSQPSDISAGRCPLQHGLGPSLAACGVHKKANEVAKEATKQSAEISNKSGEKVEETTPGSALSA
jgi:hypothetical protein